MAVSQAGLGGVAPRGVCRLDLCVCVCRLDLCVCVCLCVYISIVFVGRIAAVCPLMRAECWGGFIPNRRWGGGAIHGLVDAGGEK